MRETPFHTTVLKPVLKTVALLTTAGKDKFIYLTHFIHKGNSSVSHNALKYGRLNYINERKKSNYVI